LNLVIELNDGQAIELLAVYRPPDKSKLSFLEELELFVENNKYKHSIIVGDVNINILDAEDQKAQQYRNILAINGYKEVICNNTREERRKEVFTKSCIDHIFVKTNSDKIFGSVIATKISDHYFISCSFLNSNSKTTIPGSKIYKKYDFPKIREDIRKIPVGRYSAEEKVEIQYSKLQAAFQDIYINNSVVINSKKRRRKHKPWVTPEIIRESEKRNKLFKKSKSSPKNKCYRSEYEIQRKFVQNLVKITKNQYFQAQLRINSKNTKLVWNTINEILEVKTVLMKKSPLHLAQQNPQ